MIVAVLLVASIQIDLTLASHHDLIQTDESSNVPSPYELPFCDGASPEPLVCAKVQANVGTVTALSVCQCLDADMKATLPCSHSHDALDGHTATTGTGEQLKFCGSAPKLDECFDMQLAMTDLKLQILENVTSPFKLRRMSYKCHCPAGYKLKGPFPGPVPEYDRQEADEATMEHYYCQKIPICEAADPCKKVYSIGSGKIPDFAERFYSEVMCSCPDPTDSCPTKAYKLETPAGFSRGMDRRPTFLSRQTRSVNRRSYSRKKEPKCLMWDIGIKSRYGNGIEMLIQTQKIMDQLYSTPGLQDTMLDLYRPIEIPCLNPARANLVDQQ